jgi:hypothetical protein
MKIRVRGETRSVTSSIAAKILPRTELHDEGDGGAVDLHQDGAGVQGILQECVDDVASSRIMSDDVTQKVNIYAHEAMMLLRLDTR